MHRMLRILLGLGLLAPGSLLLITWNVWPLHLALQVWPLYASGPLDAGLWAWTAGAGLASVVWCIRARRERGRFGAALAGAACLGVGLWALFPRDAKQVVALATLLQGFAAWMLLTAGLHVATHGKLGPALQAGWGRVLRLRRSVFLGITAAAAAGLAAALSLGLFGGAPVISDGHCYLYLARLLTAGRLTGPIPVEPPLASLVAIPYLGGDTGWFIQHPPGYSLLLAAGVAAGASWVVNPLLHGALVAALHGLGREVRGESLGRAAALLGLVAPWTALYAATHMAHTASMTALTAFAWALLRCRRRGWAAPLGAGLFLGAALTIRPYSAMLFAVPFLLAAIGWWWRRPRWFTVRAGGFVLALALPVAAWLLYNRALFGSCWTLGYQALHGSGHDLGFGLRGFADTLEPFTPWMGFTQTQARLGAVQLQLLAWPVPLLLLAMAAFRRGSGRPERWCAASFLCVAFGYGLYFNRGDWLVDPRFLLAGCPALLVVVGAALVRVRRGAPLLATAVFAAVVMALGWRFPAEAEPLRSWLMRHREQADPVIGELSNRRGILFLPDAEFEATGGPARDPFFTGPLITARAAGRVDARLRACFPDRPGAWYVARAATGRVLYEPEVELARLADDPSHAGSPSVQIHRNLGEANDVVVVEAGAPLRFRLESAIAPDEEAIVFGWIRPVDSGATALVAALDGREVWRRSLESAGVWHYRDGWIALPREAGILTFRVEGAGRVGLIHAARIRARVVKRFPSDLGARLPDR